MTKTIRMVAIGSAAILAVGGLLALTQERLILAGTLFVLTAVAIFIRETH